MTASCFRWVTSPSTISYDRPVMVLSGWFPLVGTPSEQPPNPPNPPFALASNLRHRVQRYIIVGEYNTLGARRRERVVWDGTRRRRCVFPENVKHRLPNEQTDLETITRSKIASRVDKWLTRERERERERERKRERLDLLRVSVGGRFESKFPNCREFGQILVIEHKWYRSFKVVDDRLLVFWFVWRKRTCVCVCVVGRVIVNFRKIRRKICS